MKRLIDFSSRFRILKGGKVSLVVSALIGSVTLSFASPTGGTVTSGSASISQNGAVTNITQSTQKASINWQNFSIASNETVNFNQPNSSSITLNRVIGNERSIINGALNANGQVWILNSNGVLFGKNASINTAGLLATTAKLSDTDFQNGKYTFTDATNNSIINEGTITISDGGSVVLASNEVRNGGTIKAIKGKIHLVGADSYNLNLNGNSLVNLKVDKGVLDALIENSNTIIADGGEIYLTTNAVDELLKGVVNNTGIIEANSIDGLTGHVELFAHGGEAQVGGTITAKDGFVETSGREFTFNGAKIEAGEWLIDPVNVTIDDSLATAIETQLESGDATINTDGGGSTPDTSSGESGSDGNIYVESEIEWSTAQKLTLDADNSIYVKKALTASNANGQVALYYGDSGDYYLNAPINLQAGDNFFTKKGSAGETTWTVVTTANALESIALGANSVLGADVDASGITNWDPIGDNTTKFTGTFDGLGHTVSNLTINRSSEIYVGLFGYVNEATIKNIGLIDVDITGATKVGGLVGNNKSSTIENAYATGTVRGDYEAGGLVGNNNTSSTIKNSYTSGKVTGTSGTGGLVGTSFSSTIENSYTSVEVNGVSNVGGLVGYINNSSVTNSYYDKTVNTGMSDEVAYGKTTGELQQQATYNGYDFTNVWEIDPNVNNGLATLKGLSTLSKVATTPSTQTTTATQSTQQEEIANIITPILNGTKTVVKLPKTIVNTRVGTTPSLTTPKVQTPQMKQTNTNIANNFGVQGINAQIVSTTSIGENANTVVTLADIKQAMNESSPVDTTGTPTQEVRVPLSKNSIVDLVNGGVNLPSGVEQQFFVVANEEN